MRLLIPILAIGTLACTSAPEISEQQFLQAHKAVKIDTRTGSGSGFAISPTEVLTAWHVVVYLNPDDIHLGDMSGQSPSTITRIGKLDVALLTFDSPHGMKIWDISEVRPIAAGEPVYMSGYGVGVHWWSRGIGTGDPDRVSLNIAPGDSGSPVYSSTGAVLGIAVARGVYGNHHSIIVPITAWAGLSSRQVTSPPSTHLRVIPVR